MRPDSLPAAGVFADGRSAELCRTPCSFNVDLADGGPTDRRTFLLRVEGYKDRAITVDFAASQRDFSATLDRVDLVPTVPVVTQTPVEDTTDTAESDTEVETDTDTIADRSEKASSKKGGGKKARKGSKVDETRPEPKPDVAETRPPETKTETKTDDTNLEPVEKTPVKKPAGTIDPSDTIDPFRRKK